MVRKQELSYDFDTTNVYSRIDPVLRATGPELISQHEEDSMNQDQFKRFWKNLEEPLKAKWDKLTAEDLLQIDGDMSKFQEVLAVLYGSEKETVSTWANRRDSHLSGNYTGCEFGLKTPAPNAG